MNLIFQTILSMSLSGTLFILILLFGGRLWKDRLSRQWQYYIWLVVVARLLLPFGSEMSLMGRVYQAADGIRAQTVQSIRVQTAQEIYPAVGNSGQGTVEDSGQDSGQGSVQDGGQDSAQESDFSLSERMALACRYLWALWLTVALGLLIRKITLYQSYVRYVKAGAEPVSDLAVLDHLAVTAVQLGIGRTVELSVNPLVASPMLVGYFHPCIVLPRADVSEKEFECIATHELMHYRRRDICYKWLVQLTVCLHWFNPFVYLMRREMEKACEFACDEAVVAKMGYDHAREYGETLLDAMASAGIGGEPLAAVTMSADKELLKERLGAIMNCKKGTKRAKEITGAAYMTEEEVNELYGELYGDGDE